MEGPNSHGLSLRDTAAAEPSELLSASGPEELPQVSCCTSSLYEYSVGVEFLLRVRCIQYDSGCCLCETRPSMRVEGGSRGPFNS